MRKAAVAVAFLSLCALLGGSAGSAGSVSSVSSAGSAGSVGGTDAISPGLAVLRAETRLVKCCVNGQKVDFAAEEFAELTGADFDYLTLCSLPALEDGVLKFAGVDAAAGQSISAAGLSLLKFLPASGFRGSAAFSFKVCASGRESGEMSCLIRFSETVNFAPVAVSSRLRTYKNVSVTKRLPTYDPEGEALSYVVERYPLRGRLAIAGGSAVYTPAEGFVGEDSFTYRAYDGYGHASEAAEARVVVGESDIYFADMCGDSAHLDAILVSENDIMSYAMIGDSFYFAPDEKVSRIDFAVMLVSAAGIEVPDKRFPTDIFVDTASQSRGKRLCLEAAVTHGLVEADRRFFRPDAAISASDAAAMTERALSGGARSIGCAYFADRGGSLTRKDAAVLLSGFVVD